MVAAPSLPTRLLDSVTVSILRLTWLDEKYTDLETGLKCCVGYGSVPNAPHHEHLGDGGGAAVSDPIGLHVDLDDSVVRLWHVCSRMRGKGEKLKGDLRLNTREEKPMAKDGSAPA